VIIRRTLAAGAASFIVKISVRSTPGRAHLFFFNIPKLGRRIPAPL
jgi:hypothetical protein